MKKYFLNAIVIACVLGYSLTACNGLTDGQVKKDVASERLAFIQNQSIEQQKENFKKLSDVVQKELWIDKLMQMQQQPLPIEHQTLLKKMITELNSNGYITCQQNPEIISITKRLFEITPKTDLEAMFFKLEDYSYSGRFDFPSGFYSYDDLNSETTTTKDKNVTEEECTCRWTCERAGHRNCTATNWGCGMLWIQSCNRRLT